MCRGVVIWLVIAGCAGDPPPVQPVARCPGAARVGDCDVAEDCELQSRCYWSQPAECIPHHEFREMLCGNNDPPDPSHKLEACECKSHACVVVPAVP